MNWKRGLLFATTQLGIAASMISWDVSTERNAVRSGASLLHEQLRNVAWQEEPREIPFDPCHGGFVDRFVSSRELVVTFANLPISVFVGWKNPCPPSWTVEGIFRNGSAAGSSRPYFLTSMIFCALVPVEWFLIGAFPLLSRRHRLREPGTLITICASVSAFLVFLQLMLPIEEFVEMFTKLLMLAVSFCWLYWIGLLCWKIVRDCWRTLTARAT